MRIWGDYEAVRDLGRSGLGVSWAARPVGGGESDRVVLKTTEDLASLGDHDYFKDRSREFLESAKQQKRLVEKTGAASRWVKIHQCGLTDQGAFYVADRHRTLAGLLEGATRLRVDAAELREIVLGVIDGLVQLQELEGRPHGALSAQTVLIRGREGEPVAGKGVLLTEMRAASLLAQGDRAAGDRSAGDRAEDYRALGKLISWLVTQREPAVDIGLTASMSPEWERLGKSAAPWIDLTNELLASRPGAHVPPPEQLRDRVPSAALLPRKTPAWVKITAVAVVVLGGATAAWVLTRPPPPPLPSEIRWGRVVRDYRAWFGPEARKGITDELSSHQGISDTAAGVLWSGADKKAVRGPAEILGENADAKEDALIADDPGKWVRPDGTSDAKGTKRLRDAFELQQAIETSQSALKSWIDGQGAAELSDRWVKLGWKAPASLVKAAEGHLAYIATPEELFAAEKPAQAFPPRPAIGRALALVQYAGRAEALWGQTGELGRKLSAETKDPVLQDFVASAAKSAGMLELSSNARLEPSKIARIEADDIALIMDLGKRIGEANKVGEGLLARLGQEKTGAWSYEEFRASGEYGALAAGVDAAEPLAVYRKWMDLSRNQQFLPAPEIKLAEEQSGLKSRIDDVSKKLDAAEADENRKQVVLERKLRAELEAARKTMERLVAMRIVTPKMAGSFRADTAAVDKTVALLRDEERGIPPAKTTAEIVADARSQKFGSARLNQEWAQILGSINTATEKPFAVNQRLKRVAGIFERIETELVVASCAQGRADAVEFDKAAAAQRVRAIGAAFDALKPALATPPEVEKFDLSGVKSTLTNWNTEALALCTLSAALDAALAAGVQPDQTWEGRSQSLAAVAADFVTRSGAAGLDAAFRDPLAALRALGGLAGESDSAKLRAAAGAGGGAGLSGSLAALERLASPAVAWPAAESDGPAAAALLETVGRLVDAGGEPARGRATRVTAAGRAIWIKLYRLAGARTDNAARAAGLASVFDLAGRMGFAGGDGKADWPAVSGALAKASPEGPFNLELWLFSAAVKGMSEQDDGTQTARVVAGWKGRLDAALNGVKVDPVTAAFLLRVTKASEDPKGRTPENPATLGPLAAGSLVAAGWKLDEAERSEDSYVYRSQDGKHVLEFRKLTERPELDVMLSTREVPVSLFIDTVTAAKKWGDVVKRTELGGEKAAAVARSDPADLIQIDWPLKLGVARSADRRGESNRHGPITWIGRALEEGGPPIEPAAAGASVKRLNGWYRADEETDAALERATRFTGYLPGEPPVPAPDGTMPMTWVSPEAAVYVSRLLGCRLPTIEEWLAARPTNPEPAPNLRDSTWRRHVAEYERLTTEFKTDKPDADPKFRLPHGNIFWPAEILPKDADGRTKSPDIAIDAEATTAESDGVLFFRPAERAPGTADGRFVDMVGNVAEYVCEKPDETRGLKVSDPKAGLGTIFTGFPGGGRTKYAAVKVIGGSALSPPSYPGNPAAKYDTGTAYELASKPGGLVAKGFSDVGFRLALPATGYSHPSLMAANALKRMVYLRAGP